MLTENGDGAQCVVDTEPTRQDLLERCFPLLVQESSEERGTLFCAGVAFLLVLLIVVVGCCC